MLGFLKKLFGFDKETMKEANVQLEQQAPYKVEVEPSKGNADYYDAPEWLRDGDPKTMGEPAKEVVATKIEVVEEVKVAVKEKKKPAAMTATKKSAAPKKTAAPKPATAPKRGRKPKAKS